MMFNYMTRRGKLIRRYRYTIGTLGKMKLLFTPKRFEATGTMCGQNVRF